MTSAQTKGKTTLVLGATGGTGKWVVRQLLDQGHSVKVVVRSKERMMAVLKEIGQDPNESYEGKLTITEASLLDLSDSDWETQVQGCDAVVSCVGHVMTLEGMYGKKDRGLVTNTVKRVLQAMATHRKGESSSPKPRFLLMGSEGVANPNGGDDRRSLGDRILLAIIRGLVPPHADNEAAAHHVYSLGNNDDSSFVEWSVIRPTDLIDGPPTGNYQVVDKPRGSLFGTGVVTRSHVAQHMVTMIVDDHQWEQYKFQMPCIYDIPSETDETKTDS